MPSVVVQIAWVSPRVKSAEPWVRGRKPTIASIGRTVFVVVRPSMRRPVLEDGAADDVGLELLHQLQAGEIFFRILRLDGIFERFAWPWRGPR